MSKPVVLILEDDATSAEALSFILHDWGAEVVHVPHGVAPEALPALLAERLDGARYIITDYHLGDGPDGITIAQRLLESAPQARLLVLSGSFHGRATAAAAKAGIEIMQKPARADAIIAWLERK